MVTERIWKWGRRKLDKGRRPFTWDFVGMHCCIDTLVDKTWCQWVEHKTMQPCCKATKKTNAEIWVKSSSQATSFVWWRSTHNVRLVFGAAMRRHMQLPYKMATDGNYCWRTGAMHCGLLKSGQEQTYRRLSFDDICEKFAHSSPKNVIWQACAVQHCQL